MTCAPADTTSRAALVDLLESAWAETRFRGHNCRCPFCHERSASAYVYEKDGAWRFMCRSGHNCGVVGDWYDIKARIDGIDPKEAFKLYGPKSHTPTEPATKRVIPDEGRVIEILQGDQFRVTRTYRYPDGFTVYRMSDLRTGKKTFRQVHQVPGGWIIGKPDKPLQLYRSETFDAAPRVLVVEGEKAAEAARMAGICATTSAMGAGKASSTDWSSLAGRSVVLWGDNHDEGERHMDDVLGILEGLDPPPSVRRVDASAYGLPHKGDVADLWRGDEHIDQFKSEVEAIIEDASATGAGERLANHIDDIASGLFSEIEIPIASVTSRLTRALLPGTVTVLCGAPGSSKSFFLLEMVWRLMREGVKCAMLALEDDETLHTKRVLAQMSGNQELTNPRWIQRNPLDAKEAAKLHGPSVTEFGRALTCDADARMKSKGVIEWMEQRGEAGARIIVVDPVTALPEEKGAWIDAHRMITSAKRVARKYGASVVLSIHPIKQTGGQIAMGAIAGGSAYARLARCILWLERLGEPTEYTILHNHGALSAHIDRVLHILKSTNGRGAGHKVGFVFNSDTLCFEEHGVAVKKKKEKGG